MIIEALLAVAWSGTAPGEPDADADKAAPSFRVVTAPSVAAATQVRAAAVPASVAFSMESAVQVARGWGTVTSTYRSPSHNRRVGGARNSHHLRNRAIDIARRPGVTHRQIDAAFRQAGYLLIESLDEGDHSHFAFAEGRGAAVRPRVEIVTRADAPSDGFRVVLAPRARD